METAYVEVTYKEIFSPRRYEKGTSAMATTVPYPLRELPQDAVFMSHIHRGPQYLSHRGRRVLATFTGILSRRVREIPVSESVQIIQVRVEPEDIWETMRLNTLLYQCLSSSVESTRRVQFRVRSRSGGELARRRHVPVVGEDRMISGTTVAIGTKVQVDFTIRRYRECIRNGGGRKVRFALECVSIVD